ncbi:hypothetical protein TRIUR3_01010 [Triticum urartu]|uniref:RNA polymerase II-associated factor 1-like protein n=1 Tax=Triticum urartu TaxID=4572 RepID=M8AEY7_TRIUA|nr:hypothetical protein TRIUR3_01010 [Triticum urartu]
MTTQEGERHYASPLPGIDLVHNQQSRSRFRNELPDPSAQLKWLPLNKDKDRYTKYRITSLEKNYMPKMIVPEDLGIPLDLLDMSVYNPMTFSVHVYIRQKRIKAIAESFKAAKSRPVHQTKRGMEPEFVLPLVPDFDRYNDPFVMVNFDGDPTADSEQYTKLERPVRDECESQKQALMKSFQVSGSDPAKQERFLAYMAPAPHELAKDLDDENEDFQYSWIREYHWEVRGDDKQDPTTYLVSFDDDEAKYLPLPTKLVLQKKKAKEGRSGDEIEHFPVPSRITGNLKRRRSSVDDDLDEHPRRSRVEDPEQYSEDDSE